MTEQAEHLPQRPVWTCRECGKDWPCADARASMLVEYAEFPATLLIYLDSQHGAAMADLGAPDLARFLWWARRTSATPAEPVTDRPLPLQ
jgi:hypothetical protein